MERILKGIANFINEKSSDQSINKDALIQLEKLQNILNYEDKSFELNNEDYGVYLGNDEVNYGGHGGSIYTLDIEEFSKDVEAYLENWWLPTLEGNLVDIWLLK